MNNNVKIIVYCSSYKFINFLVNKNIKYNKLVKNSSSFCLTVDYDSYIKISHYYKCDVICYYGINGIIRFLSFYKYFIISFIISLLFLYLLCNTIFKIDIYCEDEYLDKISSILNEYDISLYKRKKSYDEISIIKDDILDKYSSLIDWIEIKSDGVRYIVNLNIRVNNKYESLKESSIVSKYDAVIKRIVVKSGEKRKEVNDYVRSGEVLISGYITKDNKITNRVHSDGEVYGEVWYLVDISIPYNYVMYENSSFLVNRYYYKIGKYEGTLIGKYNCSDCYKKKYLIFDKSYLPFKIYKEEIRKSSISDYSMDDSEVYNYGIDKATHEIQKGLSDDEYIISKKVLKKEVSSSKMILEVFFKVYRNIKETSGLEKIGEEYEENIN